MKTTRQKTFPNYSFPGGYPIFYVCESSRRGNYHAVLCGDCAKTETACELNNIEAVTPFIVEESEVYCEECGKVEGGAYENDEHGE